MSSKLAVVLEYTKAFLGKPYIWGGSHPSLGYDCSGLVQEILASVGLDPFGDQTAQTLYHALKQSDEFTDIIKPQPGTVLFFGSKTSGITHTAFAITSEHMIEAGGGGSKTITVKDAVHQQAFVRVRPISHRKDLVASLLPKY